MPRRRSKKLARSQSDLSEQALRFLTLVSLIVGLPLAIVQGRPASAIITIAILILGLANALTYLWRRRLPSGHHKYMWQRWAAIAVVLMIVGVVAAVNINPSGRSFFVYHILGFKSPITLTHVGQITVAQSPGYVRVLVPVTNNTPEDQQINQMTLAIDWTRPVLCSGPPTFEFQLQDTLYVNKKTDTVTGSMMAESGIATGFSVPVIGKASGFCENGSLTLHFIPPALIVTKLTTSIIAIDIPKQIEIDYVDRYPAPGDSMSYRTKRGRTKLNMATVLVPKVGGLDSLVIQLSARTVSGTTITACGEEQASPSCSSNG